MTETTLPINSLVLYKKRPARVIKSGDRLEIELDDRNQVKVRPKDVTLLHPGPAPDLLLLQQAASADDEAALAWEILREAGAPASLAELTELALGDYTPLAAWTAWRWVEDGIYFQGAPDAIVTRSAEIVLRDQETRRARHAETEARRSFLARAAQGKVSPEPDARYLQEIQDLALGRRSESRLLRELGRSERPETAHALLLEWEVWPVSFNPYPIRQGLSLSTPSEPLPQLVDEPRLDLTGVPAYAIDDRGNEDPDDAVSLVECRLDETGRFTGGQIWVHVADAAAIVPSDSPADQEARSRAVTLYLPEAHVPMLPPEAVTGLGLGLQPTSPALSFKITLDAAAEISAAEVHLTRVCVQRLSYDEVETHIETQPFAGLYQLTSAYEARRKLAGAFDLDLPETILHIVDGTVTIKPLTRLHSRNMIRDAMLMAGEAAAYLARLHAIPVPYVVQEPPLAQPNGGHAALNSSTPGEEATLAARFALRRTLRRSRISSHPAPHTGIGLEAYCRVTSPLRRYLDLAVHQQLRRWLSGQLPLNETALFERIGGVEAAASAASLTESLSRRHWTLIYLLQNPEWRGEAVLVDAFGTRGVVLIPELALEAPVYLRTELPLDSRLTLAVRSINLTELDVSFNVL